MIILQIIFLVLWCLGIIETSLWIIFIPLYLSITSFIIYFIGYSVYKKSYNKDLYYKTSETVINDGECGSEKNTDDSSDNFELGYPGTGGAGGENFKSIIKYTDNDYISNTSNSNIGNGGKGIIPGTGGLYYIPYGGGGGAAWKGMKYAPGSGGGGRVITIYDNTKNISIDDKYST